MILYVVSQNPEPLLFAIERAGVLTGPMLEIRRARRPPTGRQHAERSVAVIDLASSPPDLQPPPCASDAEIRYLLLVARHQVLNIPWVEFCVSRQVELVTVDGGMASDRKYKPLAGALSRLVGSLNHEQLTAAVVEQNEWLKDCEDLVRAVLADAWRVRDPIDLTRLAGVLPGSLRARCEGLGLTRVEHFITLVRSLAFELLTGVERMSARRARLIVGISDPSNFRRQLRRVRYPSRAGGPGARVRN